MVCEIVAISDHHLAIIQSLYCIGHGVMSPTDVIADLSTVSPSINGILYSR